MRTPPDALRPKARPVLVFDFDNTITHGDVLDQVIERFTVTDDWRRWEDAWSRGEVSTRQCLENQVAGLVASQAELLDFVADFPIDPNFETIVRWAASEQIQLIIVSDNFSCLVREILSGNVFADIPLFANKLTFSGNRPKAHFPYTSRDCARCANCKVTHFKSFLGRNTIYVGDGLSDVCPALEADLVFAKDSLAEYLGSRDVAFQPFVSLDTVAEFLIGRYSARSLRREPRWSPSGAVPNALVEGQPGDS